SRMRFPPTPLQEPDTPNNKWHIWTANSNCMAIHLSDDFITLDATAQADLVRRNQVQPIELVEAAIKRIERINPLINAVITPMYDEARASAKGPLPDGPFKGVPFLLKDLGAMYRGVRMSSGSKMLRDFEPLQDSELTIRYNR